MTFYVVLILAMSFYVVLLLAMTFYVVLILAMMFLRYLDSCNEVKRHPEAWNAVRISSNGLSCNNKWLYLQPK